MEPKKVRTAISLTLAAALIIAAGCLCVLFDFNPFPPREPVVTTSPMGLPPGTPVPGAAPAETPVPGADDLQGSSEQLYHPKPENYLKEYAVMITRAPEGEETVSLLYRPEPKLYARHVIMELEKNLKVTAIAQENGYTLVLVKEGLAGWVLTQELDPA